MKSDDSRDEILSNKKRAPVCTVFTDNLETALRNNSSWSTRRLCLTLEVYLAKFQSRLQCFFKNKLVYIFDQCDLCRIYPFPEGFINIEIILPLEKVLRCKIGQFNPKTLPKLLKCQLQMNSICFSWPLKNRSGTDSSPVVSLCLAKQYAKEERKETISFSSFPWRTH